jgi:hypothetical protein
MKTSNDNRSGVASTPVDPDAKISLRVPCVECRDALVVPLPYAKDSIADLVDDHLWILSTLTPPGSKTIVLGLLCPRCAERIYPPEVLRAAEEARQKRRLLS